MQKGVYHKQGEIMSEQFRRNPFMDYRNVVPFMDLSGYIVRQPSALDEKPAAGLQEYLFRKKHSGMVNFRRFQYCRRCEVFRNGRK